MLHAVLEPVLLLVAAVPVGVALCDLVLHLAGPGVLGRTVDIGLPTSAWWAAGGAALGGLVAVAGASSAALRRSVVDQWRRTERQPRRRGWVVDAIVVTLAVAGFVDLATAPASASASRFVPAAAPALLAVACALLGARLLPLIARAGFRATRASRHVALFVAIRQVGRRTADLRVFALLTVAVALFVFGLASRSVFDRNQRERALAEVGADRVVAVRGDRTVDPSAVVARLDPAGKWAAAVYAGALGAGGDGADTAGASGTVLVVDPARFAHVAFWRSDFGPRGQLADQLAALRAQPPSPVPVTASGLLVRAAIKVVAGQPVELHVGLTDRAGNPVDVRLGSVVPSPRSTAAGPARDYTATVPQCAGGCLFRRISLVQKITDPVTAPATIQVTAIDAVAPSGARPLLPALLKTAWSALDTTPSDVPAETVRSDGTTLSIAIDPTTTAADLDQGYSVVSNLPARVPALATSALIPRTSPHRLAAPIDNDSAPLVLNPTRIDLLPRAGRSGLVVPRAWLAAGRPAGYYRYRPNQVWLSAQAPADFPARLRAAGLSVGDVQSAGERARTLAAQGPSFAVAMLVGGGGAAAVLAVLGASASLFISSRRRLYEMAAMRSLGARRSRLLASLVLEQGAVGLLAGLVGLGAGLLGARVALVRLPEFADKPSFPPLLFDLPVLLCVLFVLAVVAAVSAIAALGGTGLVRQAAPSRLREAQG